MLKLPLLRRPTKVFYGWWVVTVCALVNALGGGINFYGFSVLFIPLRDDLKLSSAATALVFSLSRAEGAIGGPFAGYLIDRFGARINITIGAVIVAGGYMLLSLTNSFVSFLVVYLLVISVAVTASFGSATMAVTTRWFVRRRGMAMAVTTAAFSVGGALITPILALAVHHLGWRTAAFLAGVAIAVTVTPISFFVRNSPESMGLRPDGDSAPAGASPEGSETDFTLREALRTRAFWIMAIATFFRVGVFGGLVVHFVPIVVWKGQSEATGALLLSALAFMGIPLRLVFGWLGDRLYKPFILAGGLGVAAVAMLILQYAHASWQLWLFVVVMAVGDGMSVLNWANLGDFFGRRHFATIRGTMGLIFTWGLVIMPVLAGFLFDRTQSYSIAIWLFTGMTALAVVAFASLRQPTKVSAKAAVQGHVASGPRA